MLEEELKRKVTEILGELPRADIIAQTVIAIVRKHDEEKERVKHKGLSFVQHMDTSQPLRKGEHFVDHLLQPLPPMLQRQSD